MPVIIPAKTTTGMVCWIIDNVKKEHLHNTQDNTKNLAAIPSPRIRTMRELMSVFNADGIDGERERHHSQLLLRAVDEKAAHEYAGQRR